MYDLHLASKTKKDCKGPLRGSHKSYRAWATQCHLRKPYFVHQELPDAGSQNESQSGIVATIQIPTLKTKRQV